MFKVKICGVTTVADAQLLVDVGADAIGLNFYAPSPRSVSVEQALEMVEHLDGRLQTIGVFVNASLREVVSTAEQLQLSAVQLHGDELPEMLADLPGELKVIRAFRVGDEGVVSAARYLEKCQAAGRLPDMALVDAASGSAYGGTGKSVDWNRLAEERGLLGEMPLALAGGLTGENVAEAIQIVQPDAIDTASGVESAPGVKSPDKSQLFAANALEAFRRR